MFFKYLCTLLLWTKEASALEGFSYFEEELLILFRFTWLFTLFQRVLLMARNRQNSKTVLADCRLCTKIKRLYRAINTDNHFV